MIDLRSDTVTKPTPGMRRAMAEAEVGDDVYGEDPTVNRLQERAAELLGFEAALFVPSGTMGNQVAIAVHTRPGQEVILEAQSHIYNVEMATLARFSGVQPRPLPGQRGVLTADQVRAAIRPNLYYLAPTGLVCLENTHNAAGGTIFPLAVAREVLAVAHAHGIPVHLDGARIFNAAVALGRPVSELVRGFDSVMFCLSKGLGAPVGSVLCGSREFIEEARRVRKALGGGMRQAGILAAAGLYALTHHIDRLAEDHANARLLAEGLAQIPCLSVTPPETNIVLVEIVRGPTAPELAERLKRRGVLVAPAGAGTEPRKLRLVTHLDVSRQDILRTIDLFWEELRGV
ncbi:MAG: low-specificity L-threonine aldolase [Candidatus Bipolaricaulaceae bacterium]